MISLVPVILAGGSGTRLWPLSREEHPKQLLRLTGANSLLQETVMRLDGISANGADRIEVEPPIVSCHEEHRFLTLEQLEDVRHPPQRVVLEPCGRNTAPALTTVALTLANAENHPVLLVMPADHVIEDIVGFHRAVAVGAKLAQEDRIVTFGVVPTHPETGYGYIHTGDALKETDDEPAAYSVDAFVEKPDADTAAGYLAEGRYLWNSGMFVVSARTWLDAIAGFRPDIHAACKKAVDAGRADGCFFRVDGDAFAACPSDSIDYAVMERLSEASRRASKRKADSNRITAAVVPLEAGWSDVGSWRTLLDRGIGNPGRNVVQGDVFTHDTTDSLLLAQHRLLATVGIEHVVVVETADAVLVADKDRTQDVRKVVDWLKGEKRGESKTHRRVYRPWGSFEQLDAGERFQVKRLTIKPGAALSLQMHHHRAEHWVVVRGTAKVTRGDEEFLLSENESTYIPIGTKHRLENPGTLELEIIEVQSGSYLGEDDIVRFEDRYDRLK